MNFPATTIKGTRLLDDQRSTTYAIILGVWLEVCIYAVLHDQYIVRIAEEHFTLYHEPLLGITDSALLAAVHAARASIGPGLILGLACVVVGRYGPLPKVSVSRLLLSTALVIVATEGVSALSGLSVYFTSRTPYPDDWYPDETQELAITQTIQITCYAASALFSGCMLVIVGVTRWRKLDYPSMLIDHR